jgi:hypothetical protein
MANDKPFSVSVRKLDQERKGDVRVAIPTYETDKLPLPAANPALILTLPLPNREKCHRRGVEGPEITETTSAYCIDGWRGGHLRPLASNVTVCGTDALLGAMLNVVNNEGEVATFHVGNPDDRVDVHSSQDRM